MFKASQSKPAFPMTKTSAVTELEWKSYILFKFLSLDKLMRVRLFPGRKYFMDRELYSKFHISANFNLRSLNRVSRLISTACASPPVYDIDPSSFVTNSPPDWQINISFPLAIVKNFRLKKEKKKKSYNLISPVSNFYPFIYGHCRHSVLGDDYNDHVHKGQSCI